MKLRYALVYLVLCVTCLLSVHGFGQALSGIVSSSRTIDWTKAGLPATLPNGETTVSPWTPPTGRTQCVNTACSTVTGAGGSATVTQINAAIAGAPTKTYVLLPAGVYIIGGSGSVTVSGTAVSWVSGTQFQTDWVGKSIVLPGCTPTISSVNTSTSITISSGAGCSSGTYKVTTNLVTRTNYVTLVGSGPESTILLFAGDSIVQMSVCCTGAGHGNLSLTSYAVGTTTVTITGTSGTPVAGNMAQIVECDEGFTGTPSTGGNPSTCSGSYSGDTYPSGASPVMFVGRDIGNYNQNNNGGDGSGAGSGTHNYNQQNVLIGPVVNNGGGSFTVTFSPGLYSADWTSNRSAILGWHNQSDETFGAGIQDATFQFPPAGFSKIDMGNTYASWVIGIKMIVGSANVALPVARGAHNLQGFNYFYCNDPSLFLNAISECLTFGGSTADDGISDNLFISNIIESTLCEWGEGNNSGNVSMDNHCVFAQSPDYQTVNLDHGAGELFKASEGDSNGRMQVDNTHGTHDLGIYFRNHVNCGDPPFWTQNPSCMQMAAYQRFWTFIGNAIGGPRAQVYNTSGYNTGGIWAWNNSNDCSGTNILVAPACTQTTDPLSPSSQMRWGNCDTVTGLCNFTSGEVPTSLSGNAAGYSSSVPASHDLPCSIIKAAFTATKPCVPFMSGGTGISYWKVCTSFSTFPTCTGSTIPPFPIAGPELSGGPYVNGHAYDNPAGIAYNTLPLDTARQNVIPVTGSVFSTNQTTCGITSGGGTNSNVSHCEILTFTTPAFFNSSAEHLMGGFRLCTTVVGNTCTVPAPSACLPTSGQSFTSRADGEIWMIGSNTTQFAYDLGADPGTNNCNVKILYPDVRLYSRSIFQADTGIITGVPGAPRGLAAFVQ